MSSVLLHHSTQRQKTKINNRSGSITSDPESLSSDNDYFKMNETVSFLLSLIKRNTTVISNILSKGKVKVDEQSCRSERLIAL